METDPHSLSHPAFYKTQLSLLFSYQNFSSSFLHLHLKFVPLTINPVCAWVGMFPNKAQGTRGVTMKITQGKRKKQTEICSQTCASSTIIQQLVLLTYSTRSLGCLTTCTTPPYMSSNNCWPTLTTLIMTNYLWLDKYDRWRPQRQGETGGIFYMIQDLLLCGLCRTLFNLTSKWSWQF